MVPLGAAPPSAARAHATHSPERIHVTLTLRPMTEGEYTAWLRRVERGYATEQIAAGRWEESNALGRARDLLARFLQQGADTTGMLLLHAHDAAEAAVGDVWIGLEHPEGRTDTAFIYDIEVRPARRGLGEGRLLLAAAEDVVRAAGRSALELNVFGANERAARLYESGGYETVSRQMRKTLS